MVLANPVNLTYKTDDKFKDESLEVELLLREQNVSVSLYILIYITPIK